LARADGQPQVIRCAPMDFGRSEEQELLQDTVRGFKGLVEGDYDDLPEQAFSMIGGIEQAVEKAKTL